MKNDLWNSIKKKDIIKRLKRDQDKIKELEDKIKFEEGYIDKDILKKMKKREKVLEDKVKKLEEENEELRELLTISIPTPTETR